ncbi:DUF2267 domain-containing protein [Micromonospora sp. NPDC005220]|uniref:DUF2267 domain-containing protein n=1 Tax=Micromonospora sp. NPDC005220 TaxID=3155589 RepID=UPI0033B10319
MEYEDFINAVTTRAKVSTDQAVTLTRATLETLADRISAGQAEDLAISFPTGLTTTCASRRRTEGRNTPSRSGLTSSCGGWRTTRPSTARSPVPGPCGAHHVA